MPRTNEELLARAKWMRSNPTPAEARLWYSLRAKRFDAVKFNHQVVIDPYIADFVARSRKLVVEVDGDTHPSDGAYDARRTAWLERGGYSVIRFSNADIMNNLDGVLETIGIALGTAPLPGPLSEWEREKDHK